MKLHKLTTALAFGLCILSALGYAESTEDCSIRPFKAQVPQVALEDLRRRIAATSDRPTPWTDSPAGLAAFMYDYNDGEPERLLTKDDFLDDVTLYWLTNSATSSARLYWETSGQSVLLAAAQKTAEISLPVAITVFPEEVYRAPETWARRAYRNLIYFNEVGQGGHFAAWKQPELFAAELRAAFRSLREAR
jgi:pimeloyl-ACP methyl ester carboxylesterase